ncbi:hypothetical protein EUGRSUZ_G02487 [Eucalyptus grandis]|uniref:Uncharacterized protein n=2 Tax=Eucalyptus grandis TaxID=71139 RepID=A0ACC3K736_EUCGR|nr:hypothetical protein EUGRSUZ_G02487 [Eucalyptus grandis]
MAKPGLLDLEKHFAFYGAYHSNPVNVAIHMVFVWPILFTALLLLCYAPPLFGLPPIELSLFGHGLALFLNVGCLLALVYAAFYVFLDPRAGSLAALLCLMCWVAASFVAGRLGFSLAWKVVLVAQIVCWTGQFIGHGVFESPSSSGQPRSSLLDGSLLCVAGGPSDVLWIRALPWISCDGGSKNRCAS